MILTFGKPILWLFGPSFVDGYFLMFILAVGLLARATVGWVLVSTENLLVPPAGARRVAPARASV